jgi:hypothetical protein
MFALQSGARMVHLRSKLARTRKGDTTCTAYYARMKGYADEMAAARKRLDDEEVITYILAGLDIEFNLFVEAFTAKTEPQTLNDLYSALLMAQPRVESQKEQQRISINAAFRGSGRGGRGGFRGHGDGGFHGGRGSGRGGGCSYNNGNKIPCQVYGKTGHGALHCYKGFDANYNGDDKHANSMTTRYNVDMEWYTDTGATDHIKSKLDKLTMREKYGGTDQVHTASRPGMPISHVGQSTIHAHDRNLILKNILHVSNASKNLVFVHMFAHDNNTFFEFHPWYFILKDWDTRKPLLHGRCRNGLYPFPLQAWLSKHPSNKRALSVVKPTMRRCHYHLWHASPPIVQRVVSQNNLSLVKEPSHESVCDACQRAKSHQLPFPKSSSVSPAPLELVLSDVWGPAIPSIGKFKYYVSFIDDYSKFVWVYLLKSKSDVFRKFHDFQTTVEQQFDKKILAIQTDWGG